MACNLIPPNYALAAFTGQPIFRLNHDEQDLLTLYNNAIFEPITAPKFNNTNFGNGDSAYDQISKLTELVATVQNRLSAIENSRKSIDLALKCDKLQKDLYMTVLPNLSTLNNHIKGEKLAGKAKVVDAPESLQPGQTKSYADVAAKSATNKKMNVGNDQLFSTKKINKNNGQWSTTPYPQVKTSTKTAKTPVIKNQEINKQYCNKPLTNKTKAANLNLSVSACQPNKFHVLNEEGPSLNSVTPDLNNGFKLSYCTGDLLDQKMDIAINVSEDLFMNKEMACSEEDVFNWITQKMKNCSGSLSREDLKKVYKGSTKELLDIMSSSLRSSEDIQHIRTYAKNKKQQQLLKQKQEAQETIQKLELENESLRKKCFDSGLQLGNPLDKGGNLEKLRSEMKMKIAVLQSKKHGLENQFQAIQELSRKTDSLGQQMSPSYLGQPVPPVSYIFNSEQGKLETSLKGEIRNTMKELCAKGLSEGVIQRTLQLISTYPGQQRCNTLLELGGETVSAAQRITATVDLERDAKILSDELQDEDPGLDIIRPLQHHIDELTLEHARLVLALHDTAAKVKQLEQRLDAMVSGAGPEVATAARNAQLEAQRTALKNGIRQLLLQEGQEQKSQLEKAKIISNIQNFNRNMEHRKDEIVSMLGVMQKLVSETWQFHHDTTQRAQALGNDYDAAPQLYKLQQEQLKIFTGLSLLVEAVKLPGFASANVAASTLKQSWALREVEKCLELQLMQHSLGQQKHHEGGTVVADYSATVEDHVPNYSLENEIPLRLISEVSTLQHNLSQCIQKWKTQSQPIQKSLREDASTTVAQMTYSQWLQCIDHN